MADVGLLGIPNAGKSTFIKSVSAAKSRVANYPFTTIHPVLGVVRIAPDQSFVVADIPGIIAGGSNGAGLGLQFLKHLTRTKLLLHIIDIQPIDLSRPIDNIKTIITELNNYSSNLATKECWLVFNKSDLLSDKQELKEIVDAIILELGWSNQVFIVSALARIGIEALCKKIMQHLHEISQLSAVNCHRQ